MKIFLLALFVAAAVSAPAPLDEENGEAVELIVNGIAEGEPLEIGDVLDLKLKEHINGEIVSATNLLHPLTAAGIAEAAELESQPELVEEIETLPDLVEVAPEPVELPAPVLPEVVPESVDLPAPVLPIVVPESIDLPAPVLPEVIPESVDLPAPPMPEVVEELEDLPAPVLPEVPEADLIPAETLPAPELPTGEVFNDGVVQVTVNAPEPELFSTVQSWFNMVLNYFNGDVQTTHQIV